MGEGKGGGFITGLLFGGIVGAGIALAMAPRPGRETREQLLKRAAELRARADELVGQAREREGELVGRGKEMLEQQQSRVREMVRSGRETLKEAMSQGKQASRQKAAALEEQYKSAIEGGAEA